MKRAFICICQVHVVNWKFNIITPCGGANIMLNKQKQNINRRKLFRSCNHRILHIFFIGFYSISKKFTVLQQVFTLSLIRSCSKILAEIFFRDFVIVLTIKRIKHIISRERSLKIAIIRRYWFFMLIAVFHTKSYSVSSKRNEF